MRVHVKTGEGVGQGKSGGHLIGHGHRPEHLFDTGIASLGFGQQSRQGVGPTVTGRIAKTFVEFAPGDGHAIGAGSGIAVHACRTRGQHSGLLRWRTVAHKGFAGLGHLRLERAGHHRAHVIGQNGCCPSANGCGQGRGTGFGGPCKQSLSVLSGVLALVKCGGLCHANSDDDPMVQ